jgi:dipeptidyl aminopeptidase/acylaminoacyl peptidase
MSSTCKPAKLRPEPRIPFGGTSFISNLGSLRIWLACALLFVLSSTLISCSSTNENPAPQAQVTRDQPVPPATRTPAPSITPTPTRTPTLTPIPQGAPTPPPNGVTLALAPDPDETGWVASGATGLFKPDNDLNVGVLKGQAYSSILQFDLSNLAPGSRVLYAALDITGRDANNLGTTGQWTLDLLDTRTSVWDNATYNTVRLVPTLFTLAGPLPSTDLAAGVRKRIVLSSQQLGLLAKQIDIGSVSIRMSGPTQGSDNLFVWDGSQGARQPTLYLVAIPAPFAVITSIPTPADIFAAATQAVGQTLQAFKFGTPTPLPRSLATATPLPFVVYTAVPTAVNPAEASATAAYVTAVAVTTGTNTPLPPNWVLATPLPLLVPYASLTAAPTFTPTLAAIWPPDLAKRPLPGVLYNKIAFLGGSRSAPTAWVIDPDGTHLAQLSDRTYYDIAAARDIVSPDGVYMLYNAPDNSARQILQIWRSNVKFPGTPPEQLTFHTRGISFGAVWSPDGSKIAYTSTKDGREQEIFVFDLNDPHQWPRLTFSQDSYLWNQYPTWSPDGKRIAFSSDRGHLSLFTEIWVMSADGSGAKNLGNGILDSWAPVWIKWTK